MTSADTVRASPHERMVRSSTADIGRLPDCRPAGSGKGEQEGRSAPVMWAAADKARFLDAARKAHEKA